MEEIGIIASVIAAIAAIASLWFSVSTSKGYILKRIERKEQKIRDIDYKLALQYGLAYRACGSMTPLDEKRRKLEEEIIELRRKL